jgi:hypothetical protein
MYPMGAMDDLGDFIITWSSQDSDGDMEVSARIFTLAGLPVGDEFQVNTTMSGDQEYSSVAMDSAGNFVVIWSSDGQDSSGSGVYGQRYDVLGLPVGGEFQVNTTTAGDQTSANVAMDPLGDFVVTWSSKNQDGQGWGVYAQRFDAFGTPQGSEFRVNSTTNKDQAYSSVAMTPSGNFIISWSSEDQDQSGWGVYARHYAPDGTPLDGEFMVQTTSALDQRYSSLALDGLGHMVVIWTGNGSLDSTGVYLQRFSTLGANVDGAVFDEFDPNGHDHAFDDHSSHVNAAGSQAHGAGAEDWGTLGGLLDDLAGGGSGSGIANENSKSQAAWDGANPSPEAAGAGHDIIAALLAGMSSAAEDADPFHSASEQQACDACFADLDWASGSLSGDGDSIACESGAPSAA